MNIFERYAPFIQDYIYRNDWESLRAIQVAAGDAIFNTDENVLLSASTASGKTEAAFFPILTLMQEDMPSSVGAIYIGPLKALINDQFERLNFLCEEADIPVWHWHGDVSQTHKNKLLKKPSGILQITPESLEALLLHKHSAIVDLFGDLRFIVIDEVHSLIRGDRGGQTLCLIERLSKMAGVNPRRIGLSATIGDLERTGELLAAGTGRGTIIPRIESKGVKWRLSMEHFYVQGKQADEEDIEYMGPIESDPDFEEEEDEFGFPVRWSEKKHDNVSDSANDEVSSCADDEQNNEDRQADKTRKSANDSEPEKELSDTGREELESESKQEDSEIVPSTLLDEKADYIEKTEPGDDAPSEISDKLDPGYEYIYKNTEGKKCLVFVNSREECEAATTTLRRYCEIHREPDRFLIHHGNLSTSFRETAEDIMKDEEQFQTTVTTSTLELGIDIGRLERAFQMDAPFTVSSFLQRMGRTGRRELPPEMWFVMREEQPEARAMLPETISWSLLQGIAIVQLYLQERWVEPPLLTKLPFSLLYHQTMSTLASCGEMTAGELAAKVLRLAFFDKISKDDYRMLLQHLVKIEHIQKTETGSLIIGLSGERVINNFRFYAVFQENEEYTVRNESRELGTIVKPPPVGEKIALAGKVWRVTEVDRQHHKVYCEEVRGKVPAYFGQCPGDINTKILERMREVLIEDKEYPYLMKNAVARLGQVRHTARASGMTEQPLICLGGKMYCLFPWLGSYAFLALERFLRIRCGRRIGLKGLDSTRPYYMEFRMKVTPEEFFEILGEEIEKPIEPMELLYPNEVPVFEKYDEYIPAELVRKGFAEGVLDIKGMSERVRQWVEAHK